MEFRLVCISIRWRDDEHVTLHKRGLDAVYITRQLAIRDDAAMLDACLSAQRHHQIVQAASRDTAHAVP